MTAYIEQSNFKNNLQEAIYPVEVKEIIQAVETADRVLASLAEVQSLYTATLPTGREAEIEEHHDPLFYKFKLILEDGFDMGSANLLERYHQAELRKQKLNAYYKQNVKPADTENPFFDTLEKESKTELLVHATATLYLATHYEDNEKKGIKERSIAMEGKVPENAPFGLDYIDGFKACVAGIYQEAALFFNEKGHSSLSEEAQKKAAAVTFDKDHAALYTPAAFAAKRVELEVASCKATSKELDPCGIREKPYVEPNEKWVAAMERRAHQTVPISPSTGPSPFLLGQPQ